MWTERILTGLSLGVVTASLTVAAQQPYPNADQKAAEPSQAVTVTGCVQAETSVLKRNPALGSIGMGDEYVVTSATLNPGAGTDLPKSDTQTPPAETAGTSGSTGFGRVYRLTGSQEKDLKGLVGQRVEITGRFKDKEKMKDELGSIGTSGRTGELTAANTPEIIIDSVKPVSGACAPVK